jgi:hypothetical protein
MELPLMTMTSPRVTTSFKFIPQLLFLCFSADDPQCNPQFRPAPLSTVLADFVPTTWWIFASLI